MTTTAVEPDLYAGEQTRARYPDETGYVERDGVRVFWESYGTGEQTILFLPTWTLVHSRHWKAQIGYFARHFRVVTFDPRRSEEHTSELQSRQYLVCRLLLEKKTKQSKQEEMQCYQ